MKLERNENIYIVADKSIEEIDSDLIEIEFNLGLIRFSQKIRNISSTVTCSLGVLSTINYIYNGKSSQAILALLLIILTFGSINRSRIKDIEMDRLNERKEILTAIKSRKLTK